MTCTIQRLSWQNTPNNLYNFVCSLRGAVRGMELYHDANALDVDSFSNHSDGTKGKLQLNGEGNC